MHHQSYCSLSLRSALQKTAAPSHVSFIQKMEDVKWLRILTCSLLLLLSVTIEEVQGCDVNIALKKPAVQSTNHRSGNFGAGNAVNGNTSDFSHTLLQSNEWWRVDLQGQYYIKSMRIFNRRDCCRNRLQQIYILTSNNNTATPQNPHPHPNNSDWTIRYYIVGPVGDDASITLYLTEPSRHVAVFSQHDEGVTLAEVEIYSYNGQDAPSPVQTNSPTSSSVHSRFLPARAVDGNINMFDAGSCFSSNPAGIGGATQPHWWIVELQQACDQCSVVVYPYLRLFRTIGDGQFSRLSGFYIFSSNRQTPGVPNTTQNGWTTCLAMSGSVDQRGPIRAQCSQNNTRWIAVYKNTLEALELAEVQVFQREPTFRSGSSVTVTGTTTGCVEISWPAADRASSYRWICTNRDWSSRVFQLTVRNICRYSADTPVSCSVIAVGSGGVSSSLDGTGRTTCTGPTFTLTDGFPNNRRINIQNIQLLCTQVTQLTLLIYEGDSRTALQTNPITSEVSRSYRVFNNLEPGQRYRLEGYTTRSGQTSPSTAIEHTTPEIPPGRVSDLTVTPTSQNCVSFSWNPPLEPNGVITNYKYKCGDKNERTTGSAARTEEQCGFSADQSVTCSVWAVNGAGAGAQESRTVRTFCAGPTFTLSDDFPANRRINIQNIQLQCTQATQLTLTIYERDSGRQVGSNIITSDLSRDRVFNDLKPNQRYRVEGYTTRSGRTSSSTTREHTTPEIPSGRVSSLTVTPTSPYCVSLSWNPPTQPNGVITNYMYKCGSKNEKSTGSASVQTGGQCGFSPYQSVTCSVWAVNGAGDGVQDSQTVRTFCAAPTNVRLSLEDGKSAVNGKDRRKITATIEAGVVPNCARIQRFTFELRKTQGAEVVQTEELVSPNQNRGSVQFTNLDAVTNYKVVVIAENDKGNHSLPVEESVSTGELKPDSPPVGFTFQTNASCVDMSWGPPVEPNGVITLYQGTCRINSTEVTPFNTTSQNHVLCGFPYATRVHCVVAASISEGFGPEAVFNRSTGVDAMAKSLGEPGKASETTIQITIPQVIFPNKDTNLRYYLVIVQETKRKAASGEKRRKRELATPRPLQVDPDSLYNYTEAKARNLTYYVTLRLEDKKQDVSVTIGDGSSSSGYYNRPLEPGKGYKLHYSYTVELNGVYLTAVVHTAKLYRTADKPIQRSSLIALAALVVLPAVLIPLAVIFIWKRRQRTTGHKEEHGRELTSPSISGLVDSSQTAADYTTLSLELTQRENDGRDYEKLVTGSTYQNVKPPRAPSPQNYQNLSVPSRDEPAIEDPVYSEVDMSAAGGNSSTKETRIISQEFRYLKVKMHGDMDIGKLAANKSRNRNRNILPFDDYRVVLSGNNSGSDYINATYYNGILPRNRYIAAMGPTKATAGDFWQMIWQENVAVIVMITRLKEGSKMKCFQYWSDPSEGIGRMCNGITVKCISDEMFTHFRMRKMSLSKSERTQQITQLHFQEWDELKTPKSEHDFLTFYDKVESVHAQHSAAPLLVQSSCGAGRAGTFIAIHDLLTYGRTSNGVNVYECVRRLRDRRPEMVQTEAQYTFIYKILKLRNIQPIHNDI